MKTMKDLIRYLVFETIGVLKLETKFVEVDAFAPALPLGFLVCGVMIKPPNLKLS